MSPMILRGLRALRCPHITVESVYDEELPTGDYQCVACGARFGGFQELRAARAGASLFAYRHSEGAGRAPEADAPKVPA